MESLGDKPTECGGWHTNCASSDRGWGPTMMVRVAQARDSLDQPLGDWENPPPLWRRPQAHDDGDNDDDDDETVIVLHASTLVDQDNTLGWSVDWDAPEVEARRREILLRELRNVQWANFCRLLVMCMIPTSLLLLVVATILTDESNADELCHSETSDGNQIYACYRESLTFYNAFTTRCLCDAIVVPREIEAP